MDISSTLWAVGGPRIRGTQQRSGVVIGATEEMDDLDRRSMVQPLSCIMDPRTPVCTFDNAEETDSDV